MPATIDTSGAIEIKCDTRGAVALNSVQLTFIADDDASPPFWLRIQSPSGATIVDRVLRGLPTGAAQAPPPVTIVVTSGDYAIEIFELRGTARGHATLRVA